MSNDLVEQPNFLEALPDIEGKEKLTDKQAAYAYWRGMGLTPRQSMKRAGYADFKWREVELNKTVRACVEEFARQARLKYDIERDDVVAGIREAINIARDQSDPNSMIKGWTEIARITGVEAPERKQVDVNVSGKVEHHQLSQASDKQLLELLGKNRAMPELIEGEFEEVDVHEEVRTESED